MDERDDLAECVSADQTTELREVSLNAFKQDDMASVYCRHPGLTRRLLRHELAEIENVSVLDDHTYESLTLEEAVERDDPQVVGINAEVPVGALKIGSTARNNDRLTNLVSP
jgi:hypothetical protein